MTPLERRRHAERPAPAPVAPASLPSRPPSSAEPQPLIDLAVVRLLSRRGERRPYLRARPLEKRWSEYLLYPLRAWRLCLGLTVALSVLTAGLVALAPALLAPHLFHPLSPAFLLVAGVVLLVLLVGLPASFLDCVLGSAVQGEVHYILWSGNPLLMPLLSGARWLSCFLAGPVVFAGVGYLYWLNWGDPNPLDWLILTELGVVAFAYWAFALLTSAERGWLHGLNPLAIADLAHLLGWRALGVVLLAALLLLGHGWALVGGVALARDGSGKGWALLAGAWPSAVFWGTFFCRLLGVWCYRSRQAVESGPVRALAE